MKIYSEYLFKQLNIFRISWDFTTKKIYLRDITLLYILARNKCVYTFIAKSGMSIIDQD